MQQSTPPSGVLGAAEPPSLPPPAPLEAAALCLGGFSWKTTYKTYISALSAAQNQPCIVKPSKTSGPSRNDGSALTTAASAGPKMKPAHANVLSLPVYSVRCAGDTATERYDCSTACWPPEPMPWSSRPSSTTDGAAACETSVYTK